MSKRKNPFGEVAPIQLKVHVSAKHVAISQQDMEEVYSELGRKKKAWFPINTHLHAGRTRERLFHVGKGRLESNGCSVEGKGKVLVCDKLSCRCCKGEIMVPGITCKNCHFELCSLSCLHECYTCGEGFCHFCTTLK